MSLKSMTGFASADGGLDGASWRWELKSVNGRGLDIRARLPAGMDEMEPQVRDRLGAAMKRGVVSVLLTYQPSSTEQTISVNDDLLETLVGRAQQTAAETGLPPASVDGLLAIRGVCEVMPMPLTAEEKDRRNVAIFASLDEATGALVAARAAEGEAMAVFLADQLSEIDDLTKAAAGHAEAAPEAIAAQLKEKLETALDPDSGIAPDRLAQEVALLASKADIREEIDRLSAHVASARVLLSATEPVGRKFDFVAQEMMREANTLCAKAATGDISRIGLDLKNVVDQFREQCQNIE